MQETIGKYNTIKIFTENVDSSTIGQLRALSNLESLKDTRIRIMPDCHATKGSVVGTTIEFKDKKVIPGLLGSDIGCGVLAVRLKDKRLNLPKLDSVIHLKVPHGDAIHDSALNDQGFIDLLKEDLRCAKYVDIDRVSKSLGTLGGGNHFIEVDKEPLGEEGLWLIIHSGSRCLGAMVNKYYQDLAYEIYKLKYETECYNIASTAPRIDYSTLSSPRLKKSDLIPYEFVECTGKIFDDYIHDVLLVQKYAALNRFMILRILSKSAKIKYNDENMIDCPHNYIAVYPNLKDESAKYILRKGAIYAGEGQKCVIPLNMSEGTLLCVGKGNDDWNNSAPHGAGRIMDRKTARDSISMDNYRSSMQGIFTSCISKDTVDESKYAYKSSKEIINNIADTVRVIDLLSPIYNFKATNN